MLQFFRNFFGSRLGVTVTLGLLVLIALAFAAGSVATSGGLGSLGHSDRVARVGDESISVTDLSRAVTRDLDQARQQSPGLTMKDFVAAGGIGLSLDQMIERAAIMAFGEKNGIIAGKRLIDSELAKIPGLQGLDGKFSEAVYRAMLAQRQLTDAEVRQNIAQTLVAREVLRPAQYGAVVPVEVAQRYAQILKENRSGAIAFLPATAFAPRTAPSDAELSAFYNRNLAQFIRPERRVLRYAIFGADAVKGLAAPTDAEIAAWYQTNKAQYAAVESRRITQLVAPTEAAAQAIAQEVAGGRTLDAAAREKGLSTAALGVVTQGALADQTAPEVAAAAFAGRAGALVGPVKGPLGWHLLRIEAITDKPARSLAQAHAEIAARLTADRQRAALADLTSRLDDRLGQGYALTDAARDVGVALQSTPAITADGHVPDQPQASLPKPLLPVLKTAFAMDKTSQPQLAEIEPGKTYVIYDVSQIIPAAPPALAEVRAAVSAALAAGQGAANARIAARRLMLAVRAGTDLAAAEKTLGVALPAPAAVAIGREQLAALGQKAPPQLMLMFAMAPGTVKLMPAAQNQGWYVVVLKTITPGAVSPGDPLVQNVATELGQLAGNEYADQMVAAIREDVGVTRYPAALKTVATQVVGGN
ncbi:MAG: peptidyl-prolyl cis-trans isomerase [Sphingomonadales bacterium]|nr:peptidyl-prolyl cis-trans isomerase [Sphingomonadales bacterium]